MSLLQNSTMQYSWTQAFFGLSNSILNKRCRRWFHSGLYFSLLLQVIPVYEKGSRFQPTTVEMVEGETSPPQLLTEADLISLMEKHGIGQYPQ